MAEELTAETITDAQIEALKQTAGKEGDFDMLRVCRAAIDGDRTCREFCTTVISINAARREATS